MTVRAASAACTGWRAEAERAFAGGDVATLRDLADRALADPSCDPTVRPGFGKLVAQTVERQALDGLAQGQPLEVFEKDLAASLRYADSWRPRAWLGDLERGRGRFQEAVGHYQKALTLLQDPAATPDPPPADVIERLWKRAEQSRLLAGTYVTLPSPRPPAAPPAMAPPAMAPPSPSAVALSMAAKPAAASPMAAKPAAASPMAAKPAAEGIRGYTPPKVVLPIEFRFDAVEFTPKGRAAVEDLLASLKAEGLPSIALIGHTDHQGGAEYNRVLSRRRAEAVRDYLKAHGYTGAIRAEGRGMDEPLVVDEPGRLTAAQINQLQRRVELVR
ncbi:MAG TPA: OmpA family protein [Azospirillaceae bacterium]|nr:OmpA family protein [Azospirillaceae bacterium]